MRYYNTIGIMCLVILFLASNCSKKEDTSVGEQAKMDEIIKKLKAGKEDEVIQELKKLAEKSPEKVGEMLGDENSQKRIAAVKALAALKSPKVLSYLTQAYKDDNSIVRTFALKGIVAVKNEDALKALENILNDPECEDRPTIIRSVAQTGLEAGIGILQSQLMYSDADIRKATVEGLISLSKSTGSTKALEDLKKLSEDQNPNIKYLAIEGLLELGDKSYMDLALSVYGSTAKENVRLKALSFLNKYKDPSLIKPLLTGLYDTKDSMDVRKAVLGILTQINDPQIVPALIRSLDDLPGMKEYVGEELKKLTGQDLPAEFQPWQDWYKAQKESKENPEEKKSK